MVNREQVFQIWKRTSVSHIYLLYKNTDEFFFVKLLTILMVVLIVKLDMHNPILYLRKPISLFCICLDIQTECVAQFLTQIFSPLLVDDNL